MAHIYSDEHTQYSGWLVISLPCTLTYDVPFAQNQKTFGFSYAHQVFLRCFLFFLFLITSVSVLLQLNFIENLYSASECDYLNSACLCENLKRQVCDRSFLWEDTERAWAQHVWGERRGDKKEGGQPEGSHWRHQTFLWPLTMWCLQAKSRMRIQGEKLAGLTGSSLPTHKGRNLKFYLKKKMT